MSRRGRGVLARLGSPIDTSALSNAAWRRHLDRWPATPRSPSEIEALASKLYRNTTNEHRGRVGNGFCCGFELQGLLETSVRNPELSDAEVDAGERAIAALLDPLPHSVSGTYCVVSYTTAKESPSATTKAIAEAVARDFDDAWVLYTGLVGKPPKISSVAPDSEKQRVEIRALRVGGSVAANTPLKLNNQEMTSATNRRWTVAHECFHLVQFAFGVDVIEEHHKEDLWFLEGSATWAAVYATAGGAAPLLFDDFREASNLPVFDQTYSAFPIWAYFSGFLSNTEPSLTWSIREFLELFEQHGKQDIALGVALTAAVTTARNPSSSVFASFVGRYTLAKWNGRWASSGDQFDRTEPSPYLSRFTNIFDDQPLTPPAPKATTSTVITATDPVTSGPLTLKGGTVQVHEYRFAAGTFRHCTVTLFKSLSARPLVLSSAVIDPTSRLSPAFVAEKHFRRGKVKASLPTLDLKPTATSLLVICVDGKVRPAATNRDIDFQLQVTCQ